MGGGCKKIHRSTASVLDLPPNPKVEVAGQKLTRETREGSQQAAVAPFQKSSSSIPVIPCPNGSSSVCAILLSVFCRLSSSRFSASVICAFCFVTLVLKFSVPLLFASSAFLIASCIALFCVFDVFVVEVVALLVALWLLLLLELLAVVAC